MHYTLTRNQLSELQEYIFAPPSCKELTQEAPGVHVCTTLLQRITTLFQEINSVSCRNICMQYTLTRNQLNKLQESTQYAL